MCVFGMRRYKTLTLFLKPDRDGRNAYAFERGISLVLLHLGRHLVNGVFKALPVIETKLRKLDLIIDKALIHHRHKPLLFVQIGEFLEHTVLDINLAPRLVFEFSAILCTRDINK